MADAKGVVENMGITVNTNNSQDVLTKTVLQFFFFSAQVSFPF